MISEIRIILEEKDAKMGKKVKNEFNLTWKQLLLDGIQRHNDLLLKKKA